MGAWLARCLGLGLLGAWLGALLWAVLRLGAPVHAAPGVLVGLPLGAVVGGIGLGVLATGLGPRWRSALRGVAFVGLVLLAAGVLLGTPGGAEDVGGFLAFASGERAWPWGLGLAAVGVLAGPWFGVWLRASAPLALGAGLGVLALERLPQGLPFAGGAPALAQPAVQLAALLGLGLACALLHAGLAARARRRGAPAAESGSAGFDFTHRGTAGLDQPHAMEGSAYGRRLLALLTLALGLALALTAAVAQAAPATAPLSRTGRGDVAVDLAVVALALALGLGLARRSIRVLRAPLALDTCLWVTLLALAGVALGPDLMAGRAFALPGLSGLWREPAAASPARLAGLVLPCVALGWCLQVLLGLFDLRARGAVLIALGAACAVPRVWLVDLGFGPATLGALGVALVLVFIGGERSAPEVGRVWAPWARRAVAGARLGLWGLCVAGLVVLVRSPEGLSASATASLTTGGPKPGTGIGAGRLAWEPSALALGAVPRFEHHDPRSDVLEVWRLGRRQPSAVEAEQLARGAQRIAELLGVVAPTPLDLGLFDPAAGLATPGLPGADRWRARDSSRDTRIAPPMIATIAALPLELSAAQLDHAVAGFAAAWPWASLWFVEGAPYLVGGDLEPALDLAGGEAARQTLSGFVGILPAATTGTGATLVDGAALTDGASALRRRARNLEALAARRTAWPLDWALLVGSDRAALAARGRRELGLFVAAAWVALGRAEAPASLALESWEARLLVARADVQGDLANDPGLAAFERRLDAERKLALARSELRAGEASSAVGLLLAARRVLGDRGDVALPLAAALDLAGEDAAALETWRALGARGPALLTGSEAWLRELGYEPPQ